MIDYLAANLWAMWLALSVVLLIVELCSGGFFIMCFSVGAVCSAIVAPFAGIYVQLGVFILISALSVVMVRPLALKYLHRHDDVRVSNADAIIGRTGTVSQVIRWAATGAWPSTETTGRPVLPTRKSCPLAPWSR